MTMNLLKQKIDDLNNGLENNDPKSLRYIYDIYNAEILPMFLADNPGVTTSDAPVYLLSAGQPGAGKTSHSANIIMKEFKGKNKAHIDVDALRAYHPLYKEICAARLQFANPLTNLVVMIWQNLLVLHCIKNNLELSIQDGTFKDTSFVADLMNGDLARAKKLYAGLGLEYPIKRKPAHKFQMWVLDTHPVISRLYTQVRAFRTFKEFGFCRSANDAFLTASLGGLYRTLSHASDTKIMDRMVIFNKDGEYSFDTKSPGDKDADFGAALKDLHSRPLSGEERDYFKDWENNPEFIAFLKGHNLALR